MDEDLATLEKNKTQPIIQFPQDEKILECQWIFIVKYNADGSVERSKTRFVAREYS